MKKYKLLLLILIFAESLFLTSCQEASEKSATPAATGAPNASLEPIIKTETSYDENMVMYSNLNDIASQNEVAHIMQSHGISKECANTFIEWVNDFNQRVMSHLSDGFTEMPETGVDYSGIVYESKEADDGTVLPEANCRLTSFLLIMDNLKTNGKAKGFEDAGSRIIPDTKTVDNSDSYITSDTEAIENSEQFELFKAEIDAYLCLYDGIPTDGFNTLKEHMDAAKKAWQDRGVEIDALDGVSIINAYMHSVTDNMRIAKHTGILFDEGDKLLFVEKYGEDAPFSATWFHNRAELEEYILAREDLYADAEELSPFIMENGELIKTN